MGGDSSSSGSESSGSGLSFGNVAAGVSAGMGALSLLNSSKKNKQQKYYLQQDYNQKIQTRKNLLEKQLASRRAQLGSMGIHSSNSSAAVEERIARESFDDISMDNQQYSRKIHDLELANQENLRQGIYNTITGISNQLIK